MAIAGEGMLISGLRDLQFDIYKNAVDHGFYEGEWNAGEKIALMHSELSEALEADRNGNPPSDHIPLFSGIEEEFADVVIRILDFAQHKGLDVANAILAKHEFNKSRPYKHGGKKY